MRAAWYDRPGPATDVLRVGDIPKPVPGPGDVLVHVKASGINPSDYKQRGNLDSASGKPVVPHSDGAGIIEAIGDGVPPHWLGCPVWIWNAVHRNGYTDPAPGETGTAAEYVALPLRFTAPLPDGTSFESGACLGVPAFTAYAAIYASGSPHGRTLLVQGGTGSVGELAVQLARAGGATVIATVGNEEKASRARSAGAHHVIEYRKTDVVEQTKAIAPNGVDLIVEVDFASNIAADAAMIGAYGTIASYSSTSNAFPVLPYYDLQFKGAVIQTVQVFTMPDKLRREAIREIDRTLRAGLLRPTIAATFPLSDIAAAHTYAEGGRIGNVVLSARDGGFL